MSRRAAFAVALLAALGAAAAPACTVKRTLGQARADAAADGDDGDGSRPDGVVPLCASSPTVQFGGSGDATCSGRLAQRIFRFALCSCVDVQLGAGFRTDSFDGRAGAYMPTTVQSEGGGPVGVNGSVTMETGAEVRGTLIAAGDAVIGDGETIHGDLKTGGDVSVGRAVLVRRDAWVGGTITAPAGLVVAGDLVQPPGSTPPATLLVGGARQSVAFSVPAPCACAAGDDQAIADAVADARAANDNARIDLGARDLSGPRSGGPFHLGCGRYYVDEVSPGLLALPTVLRVEGRAALFVGGDFTAWDGLTVQLDPGAELDLFVGGDFTLGTARAFGDPRRAAALRVYVAGATASMSGATTFAGNLYAPVASVGARAIEIFGGVVARGLRASERASIHFDRAVLDAGGSCGAASPTTCGTCGDCTGSDGCAAGRCGGCEKDLDCCDPLVCSNHRCAPLVF